MMITSLTHFVASSCAGGDFLGFPKWYKYLPGESPQGGGTICTPKIEHLNDVWLIGAAILELMLRIGAVLAICFVIYGGIQFMTSQGEPEKTATAQKTIINALIGLVISVSAAGIVTFVAGRFNG